MSAQTRRREMEIRVPDMLPEELSLSDLSRLLSGAEEAILGAIRAQDVPDLRVSLVRISRRSTGLHFATTTPERVWPAFTEVAAAVKSERILPLPARSREGIKAL